MNIGADFYLVKLHRNSEGWRLTFCECINFDGPGGGTYWHLFRVTWRKRVGVYGEPAGLEFGWNES